MFGNCVDAFSFHLRFGALVLGADFFHFDFGSARGGFKFEHKVGQLRGEIPVRKNRGVLRGIGFVLVGDDEFAGNGLRTQVPPAFWLVVRGSYTGYPNPLNEKSPWSSAGVGIVDKLVKGDLNGLSSKAKKKNVLSFPL